MAKSRTPRGTRRAPHPAPPRPLMERDAAQRLVSLLLGTERVEQTLSLEAPVLKGGLAGRLALLVVLAGYGLEWLNRLLAKCPRRLEAASALRAKRTLSADEMSALRLLRQAERTHHLTLPRLLAGEFQMGGGFRLVAMDLAATPEEAWQLLVEFEITHGFLVPSWPIGRHHRKLPNPAIHCPMPASSCVIHRQLWLHHRQSTNAAPRPKRP